MKTQTISKKSPKTSNYQFRLLSAAAPNAEYEEEEDDDVQQAEDAEDPDRDAYKNADQDGMYYFI